MAGESAREVAKRSREKAEQLLRTAEMYERGADGEERTAEVLRQLPSEWTVFHDVRWPGRRLANIDHVAVGPAGVFVIDSKNWSGNLTVEGSTLRQNGRSRELTVAKCADSGLAVAELVPALADWIVPVLCFVRDEPVRGWARDVAVTSSVTLVELLTTRPHRLAAEHVRRATWELDAQLQRASGRQDQVRRPTLGARVYPAPRAARARSANVPATRRRRRKKSSPLRALMGALLILGMLTIGPQVTGPLASLFVHSVTSGLTPTACPSNALSPATTAASTGAARPNAQPRKQRRHQKSQARVAASTPTSSPLSAC